jgi:hypothetical protein
VNGSDYRISNCDTVDGSNCKIVNGANVRASEINSLYSIRREVICRVIHPTRDNLVSELFTNLNTRPTNETGEARYAANNRIKMYPYKTLQRYQS